MAARGGRESSRPLGMLSFQAHAAVPADLVNFGGAELSQVLVLSVRASERATSERVHRRTLLTTSAFPSCPHPAILLSHYLAAGTFLSVPCCLTLRGRDALHAPPLLPGRCRRQGGNARDVFMNLTGRDREGV